MIPRTVWVYFAAVASTSTAFIAAFTVGTVAALVISDTRGLSGLPATVGILATAVGAAVLSWIMARRGRRVGLLVGMAVSVLGAGVALLAMALAASPLPAFLLLLASMVGFGFGNAAVQLARYAAADLVPAADRGRALGLVVWASTIGAVAGPNLPNLVAPSTGQPGIGELTAGFGVVAVFMLGALAILAVGLRREPSSAETDQPTSGAGQAADVIPPERLPTMTEVYRLPRVRIGLVALVAGQVVMVLIMTMTPVHLADGGQGLGMIGLVISAHTFGMFAFSPVSGRLADRLGAPPVILAGFGILAVAALLSATAPVDGGAVLTAALFLLGVGWNLTFVAGSSLLTRGVPTRVRIRVQGLTDAFVWTSGAASSAVAGLVLELAGYAALSLAGAVLVLVPVAMIVLERRALVPTEA